MAFWQLSNLLKSSYYSPIFIGLEQSYNTASVVGMQKKKYSTKEFNINKVPLQGSPLTSLSSVDNGKLFSFLFAADQVLSKLSDEYSNWGLKINTKGMEYMTHE